MATQKKSKEMKSGDPTRHAIWPPLPIQRCAGCVCKFRCKSILHVGEGPSRWKLGEPGKSNAFYTSKAFKVFGYKNSAVMDWEGRSDSVDPRVTKRDYFRLLFVGLCKELCAFRSVTISITYSRKNWAGDCICDFWNIWEVWKYVF